jgi:hypothetical protein
MMTRFTLALLALLPVWAGAAWAGSILTNAQLQAEMGQTCVQQGKPSPCVGPAQFSDLIASAAPGAVNAAVTAAGTTQGTATPLNVQINDVTSVLAGSGVMLPVPVVGQPNFVCNDGANSLLVYPPTGVTIGTASANIPVPVATGQCLSFLAISPTVYKQQLAQTAVLAGTSQTVTAPQWTAFSIFEVTTSGQILTLPASSTLSANGGVFVLTGSSNVTITPQSGDAITYGSVLYPTGASVVLSAGTMALVTKPSSGNFAISATTTFDLAISAAVAASSLGAQ